MNNYIEETMVGKKYVVNKQWKAGRCKIKAGDVLFVKDWGHGMVEDYLVFRDKRLPRWSFHTGTSEFRYNTQEVKESNLTTEEIEELKMSNAGREFLSKIGVEVKE